MTTEHDDTRIFRSANLHDTKTAWDLKRERFDIVRVNPPGVYDEDIRPDPPTPAPKEFPTLGQAIRVRNWLLAYEGKSSFLNDLKRLANRDSRWIPTVRQAQAVLDRNEID